jgi:hypothetical protein
MHVVMHAAPLGPLHGWPFSLAKRGSAILEPDEPTMLTVVLGGAELREKKA